jgi:hypothetical protein
MSQEVQPPWKKSAKGSIYCLWVNLPEEIKSQIKQQDKFESTVSEFHYSIRKNQDGSFIIFRRTKEEHEARQKQSFLKKPIPRVIELLILPIQEANTLISANNEYELIGNDPVKVVNGQFFVIVGKKQQRESSSIAL